MPEDFVAYYIKGFLRQPDASKARRYLGIGDVVGGGVGVSAAGNSIGSGLAVFSNANNVTFGMVGSTVTAVATLAGGGGVAISAGANSQSTGTVIFSNSNGLTFGLNAGTLTASHNGLTSQSNQAASASNGSFTFQTLGFSNANGVTFGTSAGSIITASIPAGAVAGSISAGTTSVALGQAVFSDSNGITFGLDGSTVTASHNGLTSQSNQAASASNGSFTFQTIGFSNANGITFGTSAGSIISASHNALTSQSNQAASASNGSFTFQTLGFSNANNVTFGTSAGSIVTASVNAAGGGTISHFSPPWFDEPMLATTLLQNTMYLVPFDVYVPVSGSRINFYMSLSGSLSNGNNTGSGRVAAGYAIYTSNTGASSQSLSLLTSYSMTILSHTRSSNTQYVATHYIGLSNATSHSTSQVGITATNASTYIITSVNGLRVVAFPLNATLTPARYWLAVINGTTSGGTIQNNISVMQTTNGPQIQVNAWGVASSATNASTMRRIYGWGNYTVSTAAFPAQIAPADVQYGTALVLPHFDIAGYGTSTNWP